MKTGKKPSKGFTLIELMVVVAIISILVALAVPSYQDYTVRAKVSECIAASSIPKLSIAEFVQTLGRWPSNAAEAGISQDFAAVLFGGQGLSKYCRIFFYNNSQGDFAVWVNAAAMDADLNGVQIVPVFSPSINLSGGSDWVCTRGFTSPQGLKYLPASCRGENVF